MHILIQKKILNYGDYNVKCAIGKRGINIKKKEGDLITPRGTFEIKQNIRRDYLYYDFDPTRTDGGSPLPANNFYSYTDYEIAFSSPDKNL